MSNSIVPTVYKWVIDDVIEKMAMQFSLMGIDESVLQELQGTWEQKIINLNVGNFPQIPQPESQFIQEDDFEIEFNDLLNTSPQFNRGSAAQLATLASKPSTQQPQQHETQQTKSLEKESIQSKIEKNDKIIQDMWKESSPEPNTTPNKNKRQKKNDSEDESDEEEEGVGGGDEEPVNERRVSDNIDSDLDEDEEEIETDNIILCQYEKVARIKNKWKCQFKDGIIHVNGKDYLFDKANGEFIW